jgi:anhydro-N-acetylmuramic acid kinase
MISALRPPPPALYVGVLSGTSADGIDVALVEIARGRIKCLEGSTRPYTPATRRLVRKAPAISLEEVATLHRAIGEEFAGAVLRLLKRTGARSVRAIGSHGQTVFHAPRRVSIQLGSPAIIAKRTGLPVVADFRGDDIAAGGEGAPLVPLLDEALLRRRRGRFATLNLGGIANVTLVEDGRARLAYDIGPANALIDAAMERFFRRPFDRDGRIAGSGRIDAALLARLLAHPYLRRRPPKSTGLELFGASCLDGIVASARRLAPRNLIATLTEFTAVSVARDLARSRPERVFVSGGGRRNRFLMARLATLIAPIRVELTTAIGADPDFKEAMLFAWLADRRLRGEPLDLRRITGAHRPVLLGGIWRP